MDGDMVTACFFVQTFRLEVSLVLLWI